MAQYKTISSDLVGELFSVKDRVCLVVGTGGLGACTAEAFAHNGARVALANRTKEKADDLAEKLTKEGFEAKSYQIDVRSLDDCKRVTDEVERDFGRIDILIFTSAVAIINDPLNPDEKDLEETIKTNFLGGVHINETVAAVMRKNHWGRIININSIDAFTVNCTDGMDYAAAKAALAASTRAFAVNFAKDGITVNGIAPVWIWTPMMDQRPSDYMKQAAAGIPEGRISYPEDYLGALFFLSSEAGSYVTGQTLLIDGGWSVNRIFQYKDS